METIEQIFREKCHKHYYKGTSVINEKDFIDAVNEYVEGLQQQVSVEPEVLKKNADTNNVVYQFAGKVARAMKHLSSSHVYFILQTAFSNEDRWEEVDEILKQVISQTNVEWEEPKY